MLVGLVVLQRFDEAVELLLLAALRERPLAGVGEGPDGGQTSLNHPLPVPALQFLQSLLDANLAIIGVVGVVAAREIVVLAFDLAVLVNAHDLEGDVAVGGDGLVVVVVDHRGLLRDGPALLALVVDRRVALLVLPPRARQEVLHLREVAVLCS